MAPSEPNVELDPIPHDSFFNHHLRFTNDRLNTEGGRLFLDQLLADLKVFFNTALPSTASDTAEWFATRPTGQVENLFFAVQSTLLSFSTTKLDKPKRREIEEAASALYCISACRFVDRTFHQSRRKTNHSSRYLVEVPDNEPLTCAIITTALIGGKLQLIDSGTTDPDTGLKLPYSKYVFKITTPAADDQFVHNFERAVFNELFKNNKEISNETSLDAGPLNEKQRESLRARIRTITIGHKNNLTLIINDSLQSQSCSNFAEQYEVPIAFPHDGAVNILTGMSSQRLLANIKEFWQHIRELGPDSPMNDNQPPKGERDMPKTGDTYIANNMAFTKGDHSAAQAGDENTANITHHKDKDYSALVPLLHELQSTVNDLPVSAPARDKLTANIETLNTEVAKKENADRRVIERILASLKGGGEVLEGGEKLVNKCTAFYKVIAPLFGLPPLP